MYKPLTPEEKTHYIKLRDERLTNLDSLSSKVDELCNVNSKNLSTSVLENDMSRASLGKLLSGNDFIIACNKTEAYSNLIHQRKNYDANPIVVPSGIAKCLSCETVSVYRSNETLGDNGQDIYKCQLCDNKYLGEIKDIKLTKIE
jgi:hypothetical protein